MYESDRGSTAGAVERVISKLHDEWVKGGVSEIFNFGSMPPALAVNYASIYGQNLTAIELLRRKGGQR